MWIIDSRTRRIRDANPAALKFYGYSLPEWLTMRLADLDANPDGKKNPNFILHRKKSGRIVAVRLIASRIEIEGKRVDLVQAADVTDLVEANEVLVKEVDSASAEHLNFERSANLLRLLLEAVPAKLMILSPGDYGILGATESYLSAVNFARDQFIGRRLFDVFPEAPDTLSGSAMLALRKSLERVENTGEPDIMAIQFYPLQEDKWVPGAATTRFWAPGNWPVLNKDGSIAFIIHQTEDVTELVRNDASNLDDREARRISDTIHPELIPVFMRSQELKSANLRLQEQSANMRTAKRLLGIGIWRMHLETMRLDWSDDLAEMYDTLDSEFAFDFDSYVSLVHPDDQRGMLDSFRQFRESGDQIFQFDHRIVRQDGGISYMSGIAEIAETQEGSVLTGVVQDVTERELLIAQMKLLSEAVARINDVILITEATPIDGPYGPRIVFANEAFYRKTGFTAAETIGRSPRILQGLATQRGELTRISEALKSWQPVRAELINYTKSGEPFWLELDIVPVSAEGGQHTHFIAVQRDITARKQSEAEQRKADERFQLVTQATNDVIWDWDLPAGTLWWNSNFTSQFGHPADVAAQGLASWHEYIHADDKPRVMASLAAAIEGTGRTLSFEYRYITADGRVRWVRDRAIILRDEHGTAVRMVGSMIDFTERKQLEERLQLTERLEAIGRLTGGFAHDFNNLLTVILGNAETLHDRLPEGPMKEMAELTLSASQNGAELIRRLLSFARHQPLDLKPSDLDELLADSLALIGPVLPENISVLIARSSNLWPVAIDGQQLQAALMNLCVNARDAMPKGGRLSLWTENVVVSEHDDMLTTGANPGDYVVLHVDDTGVGMSPETLARVYEPFFTTKPPGEGSGLGLSMVYGFVRQTGGYIRIESVVNIGTHTSLYFPRWTGELLHTPKPEAASRFAFPQLHVLIVEDNLPVRQYVSRSMQEMGMSVTEASNSEEALSLLESVPGIDLLFTDIVLPGRMNGAELARAAKIRRPDLRVLFTSGYTGNAIISEAESNQNVFMLAKPYRREELEAKLWNVLQS